MFRVLVLPFVHSVTDAVPESQGVCHDRLGPVRVCEAVVQEYLSVLQQLGIIVPRTEILYRHGIGGSEGDFAVTEGDPDRTCSFPTVICLYSIRSNRAEGIDLVCLLVRRNGCRIDIGVYHIAGSVGHNGLSTVVPIAEKHILVPEGDDLV